MDFFKQLSQIADGVTLTLRIQQKNGSMAISVIPDGIDKIQPLICNGTPEWMDENFIASITKPIETVKGKLLNPQAFDSAEAAKPATHAASKDKPQNKKVEATKPDTQKTVEKADKAKKLPVAATEAKPKAVPEEPKKPELTPLELLMK